MSPTDDKIKKVVLNSKYFKEVCDMFVNVNDTVSDNGDGKLIEETIDMCTRLLVIRKVKEGLQSYQDADKDIQLAIKDDQICEIISKRLEVFKIDVIIPAEFLLIISICSNGTPGIALMMTRELLTNIRPLHHGQTITSDQFVSVFPDTFPTVLIPEVYRKYDGMWDNQKRCPDKVNHTDNMIDTASYWQEVFGDVC